MEPAGSLRLHSITLGRVLFVKLNLKRVKWLSVSNVATIFCAVSAIGIAYYWYSSSNDHEEVDASQDHVKILKLCSLLCDVAYDPKVLDGDKLKMQINLPCTEFCNWEHKDNRAVSFIAKLDVDLIPLLGPNCCEVAVISFRGTSCFNETLENIRSAWRKKYYIDEQNHFTAARGFLDAYDDIKEKRVDGKNILDVICRRADMCCGRVLIVGHSLGGAMAQAMASELSLSKPHYKIAAVTFGQPRLYSRASAQSYWRYEHWRVVNNGDPVPTLPPAELGFCHHGKAFHFETENVPKNDLR